MKLKLKKFSLDKINSDKVVVLIGKRGVGKSFLVKDLLYHHTNLPIGTIISGTEDANHFFEDFVPKCFIHKEYSPDLIDNVMKRQKKIMKEVNKEKKIKGKTTIDPRTVVVFDDCLYDQSWTKDKNVRAFFMNGRHLKIFFIITMQYPLGIPPNLRTNIDYTFILRDNITKNRRRIFENYAGMFPNYDIFSSVMDQCTQNYECLVIDNSVASNKIEDCVFWYKAENRPTFRIGAAQFWLNNDIEDSDSDNEEPYFDRELLGPKKNKVSINVTKI